VKIFISKNSRIHCRRHGGQPLQDAGHAEPRPPRPRTAQPCPQLSAHAGRQHICRRTRPARLAVATSAWLSAPGRDARTHARSRTWARSLGLLVLGERGGRWRRVVGSWIGAGAEGEIGKFSRPGLDFFFGKTGFSLPRVQNHHPSQQKPVSESAKKREGVNYLVLERSEAGLSVLLYS
jgi:hypothetical protein